MSSLLPTLPDPEETLEISPLEVSKWIHLQPDKRPRLIDCREADELEICQLQGLEWVPLGNFPEQIAALSAGTSRGLVIYCHHGVRSLRAANFLRGHGVENAFSMAGGIDAWSRLIDPAVPRY